MRNFLAVIFLSFLVAFSAFAQQGALSSLTLAGDATAPLPYCGSYELMEHADHKQPGYLEASNTALQNLVANLGQNKKAATAVLTVPVVFHVVHNIPNENLPDSVIFNQLESLNKNFRRQNADTASLRPEFKSIVGDAKIEFVLATVDPSGNPTNGITRTQTNVQYFGGTLPYAPGQDSLIGQWLNDSLFNNFYRLTKTNEGGIDAWDVNRYFNIWIGDLRIFEPQFNNLEELFVLGIASPPPNHPKFIGSGLDSLGLEQGALMHYVAIGPGNPNSFPPPYGVFNNLLADGDIMTHEAGHYLGLRHIWGDGDCTEDDFIDDTPAAASSGQFACNRTKNTCLDTVGVDLRDMVENFMDYSSDACLSAFTNDQIEAMRATLFNFRPNAFTIGQEELSTMATGFSCYPNPSNGLVNITSTLTNAPLEIEVYNIQGKLVQSLSTSSSERVQLSLIGLEGLYLIQVKSKGEVGVFRILKTK